MPKNTNNTDYLIIASVILIPPIAGFFVYGILTMFGIPILCSAGLGIITTVILYRIR